MTQSEPTPTKDATDQCPEHESARTDAREETKPATARSERDTEHENPYRDINPNDSSLGKLTAGARMMMKSDSAKVSLVTMNPKRLTHGEALSTIDAWEANTPPSALQLRSVVAGMVFGQVAEQYVNDVIKKITERWKSTVTKKILKEHKEVAEYYLRAKERKENNPEAAQASFCIVNQAGFLDQVEIGREGLAKANEKNPALFRYGTELGQINHVPETGETVIEMVSRDSFRRHLSEAASWAVSNNDDSLRGVAAPLDVTAHLYCEPNPPVPYIEGIAVAPGFDKDGNLLDKPGYQPTAYTFYAPPEDFEMPRVSGKPSPEELAEAARLLVVEWLADFPFDGYSRREIELAMGVAEPLAVEVVKNPPPSLLNFLGFVLQTPCRAIIGRSPMPALLASKPVAGVGATKLNETAQILLSGGTSTRPSFSKDEEERRKAIFSALRASPSIILFDNVAGTVDSPVLAALLTSTTFTDRVLGRSQERSVPNKASVAITGNNPRFSDELVRRLSYCRLDAGVPNPEQRPESDFRHPDLEGWVADNRGRLMWALCTLVQNWIAKGQPKPKAKVSVQSFVPWFNVIGGILEAAGWAGFQSNRDELRAFASDDAAQPMQMLVQAWYDDIVAKEPVLILPAYAGDINTKSGKTQPGLASFCDAHALTLPVKKRRIDGELSYDPTALGAFLSEHRDRVFKVSDPGGEVEVTLVKGDRTKHGFPWRLVRKDKSREGSAPA